MFLQKKKNQKNKPRELLAVSRQTHWTHLLLALIAVLFLQLKKSPNTRDLRANATKKIYDHLSGQTLSLNHRISWAGMDPQGPSRSNSCPWTTPRITPSAIPKDHSVLLDISAANKALTGHKRHNNSSMLKGLDSCKYSVVLFASLFKNGRRLKTQSIRKICSKSVSLFHFPWQLSNYI